MSRPTAIALIPARSGSSRVPHKNVRLLAGHPLLAYTIAAAQQSDVFDAIVVSTDAADYATIATHYGAEVPFLRPAEFAANDSPDIAWIDHLLRTLSDDGRGFDIFSILRPTSPLRGAATIRAAMDAFLADPDADSLRAVEPVTQHPGKMWTIDGTRLTPLLDGDIDGVPWHSNATQFLPKVWVQNASLEIAWTRVVLEDRSISGTTIVAFENPEPAGFDVNTPEDWQRLQRLVTNNPHLLPAIDVPAPEATLTSLRQTRNDEDLDG